jgi:hypothetical protein
VIKHLKDWWMIYGTFVMMIVTFISPSVQSYLSAHPAAAQIFGGGWAILLKLTKSPIKPGGAS